LEVATGVFAKEPVEDIEDRDGLVSVLLVGPVVGHDDDEIEILDDGDVPATVPRCVRDRVATDVPEPPQVSVMGADQPSSQAAEIPTAGSATAGATRSRRYVGRSTRRRPGRADRCAASRGGQEQRVSAGEVPAGLDPPVLDVDTERTEELASPVIRTLLTLLVGLDMIVSFSRNRE
jgi:hypothetical protein